MVGELSLDGGLRGVRGASRWPKARGGRAFRASWCPQANAPEAAAIGGVGVYGLRTLREAVDFLGGRVKIPASEPSRNGVSEGPPRGRTSPTWPGSATPSGRSRWRRRAGTTSSSADRRARGRRCSRGGSRGSCPLLRGGEHRGNQGPQRRGEGNGALIGDRPFRAPHHTISTSGLAGGGSNPRPGEVSLAHHGVLFLDELPEFGRPTLEVLRQPLEDGHVTISRVAATLSYPARFTLVCSMNPCPCGYAGDGRRACRCSAAQIERYQSRISGPLLDRIDLFVDVPRLTREELRGGGPEEPSEAIRERVTRARARQMERQGRPQLGPRRGASCANLCAAWGLRGALLAGHRPDGASGRGHDRVLRVARTVADLAGEDEIASSTWPRRSTTGGPASLAASQRSSHLFLSLLQARMGASLVSRLGPAWRAAGGAGSGAGVASRDEGGSRRDLRGSSERAFDPGRCTATLARRGTLRSHAGR